MAARLYRRARAIAVAMLALAPLPAAAQDAVAITDPVALFNTVCAGEQSRLSGKTYQALSYAGWPRGAREAIGFAVNGGRIVRPPFAFPGGQIPNPTFVVVPKKSVYLILPAPDGARGDAAPVCAVIWRGDGFTAAEAAMLKLGGSKLAPGSGEPGHRRTMYYGLGTRIGAAELNGWTVLQSAPTGEAPALKATP
jgi:hypothetical protein